MLSFTFILNKVMTIAFPVAIGIFIISLFVFAYNYMKIKDNPYLRKESKARRIKRLRGTQETFYGSMYTCLIMFTVLYVINAIVSFVIR